MLHAIERNKYGRSLRKGQVHWRELFKTSEDSLTSSVFGLLIYLPANLSWSILRDSCSESSLLPKKSGDIISYEFWPHWDGQGTEQNYVEPDVFIRFENFDLIVEAKRNDENQQDPSQWLREYKAYLNEYDDEKRSVYLLAIGGVLEEGVYLEVDELIVFNVKWSSLLKRIKKLEDDIFLASTMLESVSLVSMILKDLIKYFGLHGYATGEWLSEINYHKSNFEKSIIKLIGEY